MQALALGAVDVVAKPDGHTSVPDVGRLLAQAIRAASGTRVSRRSAAIVEDILRTTPRAPTPRAPTPRARVAPGHPPPQDRQGPAHLIAIGASTGGPQAIEQLLRTLPPDMPGIVIAQHMPAGFTHAFAERLHHTLAAQVAEAQGGEPVTRGTIWIAPGGKHLLVRRVGATYHTALSEGPPVHYQRPAVDPLFYSAADAAGDRGVGVLLTGMGTDGGAGLLAMRRAGAVTICQDEGSSAVFGMPREGIRLEAAQYVLPLADIGARIQARRAPER
jgi:two-component system chemotaxis response regulator CheB